MIPNMLTHPSPFSLSSPPPHRWDAPVVAAAALLLRLSLEVLYETRRYDF